jgi:sugar O-acyltransferase (sialic acid O-acetyltransferase NeuD family)
VGAGGHGAEVATYISDLVRDGWPGAFLGFLDDVDVGEVVSCVRVLGRIDEYRLPLEPMSEPAGYLVAVGDNRVRKELVERMERRFGSDLTAWTLVHPRAYTGHGVEIGAGTLLAPFAVATTRVSLGRHVILNVKASVSHDVVVGDFANINPGATICGNVTVGEGAFIGAGAVVKDKISIGAWSTIGAGAAVVEDIPQFSLAVGVPARVIKSLHPHGSSPKKE